MIDVVAGKNKKKGSDVRPYLLLVTTSDTKIGKSLINHATKKGVSLYHSVAEESDDTPGEVRAGWPTLLNPSKKEVEFLPPGKWVGQSDE